VTTVVFGVGHPDRGDDAAGWLVADLLAGSPTLAVRRVTADPSAILTDPLWDHAERIVIVDAVRTGAAPGTVHCWDLFEILGTAVTAAGGTHDLGVATTLGLAAALGRLPLVASVIGIEGRAFAPGTQPCGAVLAAVERVAAILEIESAVEGAGPALHPARPRRAVVSRPGSPRGG
jgi:hydrogenase maturation protease